MVLTILNAAGTGQLPFRVTEQRQRFVSISPINTRLNCHARCAEMDIGVWYTMVHYVTVAR